MGKTRSQTFHSDSLSQIPVREDVLARAERLLVELEPVNRAQIQLSVRAGAWASFIVALLISFISIFTYFIQDSKVVAPWVGISVAIIHLGHEFGLEVVAEGVETQGQLALLTSAGCDFIQGYVHARPMDMNQFEHFYANNAKLVHESSAGS